ncbi:Protein MOS2 [Platanthera zijinensis]|uniref:Protein MOS2 n=1 Tax=Platanthera zijinensis TaxID=2320716 RepID=A0AAP0G081_9ASPA
MKLSFSISSKSSSTRLPTSNPPESFNPTRDRIREEDDEAKPQFVLVFDPSQKLSSDAPSKHVIPPIPNSDIWSSKKTKDLPLPTAAEDASHESRFVLQPSGNESTDPGANRYGLLLRSNGTEERGVHMSDPMEDLTKRRFIDATKDLPEEEFPDVPVEGFGAAILAGYGWSEGKGIGRNNKEDPKVFEYKQRSGTEGFGYVPQSSSVGKKSQKEEIAAGFKSVNEKNSDTVGRDKLKPDSREMKEKRIIERRHDERSREEKRTMYNVSPCIEKTSVRWLRSHIRVRIVSKKFAGGKLYLKKGEVVDVVGPTTCDIRIDGHRELVQGVDQGILETALPKSGGSVLVLYGKHKGVFGSLVERDSEKETGIVRDADNHALINVLLEQIAEYVGDPSDLGDPSNHALHAI